MEWIASPRTQTPERYELDVGRSIWRHKDWHPETRALRLDEIRYTEGHLDYRSRHANEPSWARESYKREADTLLEELTAAPAQELKTGLKEFDSLRWFILPSDLRQTSVTSTIKA